MIKYSRKIMQKGDPEKWTEIMKAGAGSKAELGSRK